MSYSDRKFVLTLAGAVSSLVLTCCSAGDPYADVIETCIKLLSSADRFERSTAARKLGSMGELAKDAVPALMVAANDNDLSTRIGAFYALGQIRDPRAVDVLLEALKGEVQILGDPIQLALAKIGDAKAVPGLLQYMTKTSAGGAPPYMSAMYAIRCTGAAGRNACLDAIKGSDSAIRLQAILTLWRQDDVDADSFRAALLTALADEDEVVRTFALRALPRKDPEADYTLFVRMLEDPSPKVRGAAAEQLGYTKDPRAFDRLIVALDNNDPEARRQVRFALASLGDPRGFDAIATALYDTDHESQYTAIIALGSLGDTRAVDKLRPLLVGENGRHVLSSLVQLGDADAIREVVRRMQSDEQEDNAWDIFQYRLRDPKVVPILEEMLNETSHEMTRDALFLKLCKLRNADCREFLTNLLLNKSNRFGVSGDLARLGAVDALVEGMRHDAWEVRYACAEALQRYPDIRAFDTLVKSLSDRDSRVAREAVKALEKLDDSRVVPVLIEALPAYEPGNEPPPDPNLAIRAITDGLFRKTGRNFGIVKPAWQRWWKAKRSQAIPSTY